MADNGYTAVMVESPMSEVHAQINAVSEELREQIDSFVVWPPLSTWRRGNGRQI
jgi:hypothetical protein